MNEEVLEKILRRLRGPSWAGPSWVTGKRASRYDIKTQDSVSSNMAVEDKSDCREENSATVSDSAKPFIDGSGNLVIPSSAPDRYRWWAGGQSVQQTLIELNANEETMKKYMDQTAID